MAKRPWNVSDAINNELHPGEVVHWLGAPTFLPMLGRQVFSIMFGCFFAASGSRPIIPAAWAIYRGDTVANIWEAMFALPFVAIGVAVIAKALFDAFATFRTAYAVTDKRVLVVSALMRKKLQGFGPAALNALETSENSRGGGTLTFRREVTDTGEGTTTLKIAFVGVDDVASAARAVENLRRTASQSWPQCLGATASHDRRQKSSRLMSR